jgi:NADPH-dependent 2,4-dienoyl-CoA reductase/sulfur reductase-like enzyme
MSDAEGMNDRTSVGNPGHGGGISPPDRPPPGRRRVVILGGGFGGTYAARQLGRTLAKRGDVDVVLIARENYLLFTPMLHEVAAGDLYPADIVNPLRKMLRRVRFIEGEVEQIDLQARVVHYGAGALRRRQELSYDYLLLALGSETNYSRRCWSTSPARWTTRSRQAWRGSWASASARTPASRTTVG